MRPITLCKPRLLIASAWLFGIWLTLGMIASETVASDAERLELPVELTVTLEPARPVVPGERIRVLISVATPRWFTAGTRLRLPEIPDLLVLQNQEFASNATERRGQESWTLQRWSVDAFATRAGDFILEPIEVTASISLAPGKDKTFTLYTQPQPFSVVVPPELAMLNAPWIASPKVTLEQRIDGEDTLALGAALKRTVSITAEGVMAMMLPSLADGALARGGPTGGALHSDTMAGLQSYPEPALLTNKATRGALTAQRIETTTYIATHPGDVSIPPSTAYWWNTTDATLHTLATPETHLTISSGELIVRSKTASHTAVRLAWLGLLVLSLVGGYWLRRRGVAAWVADPLNHATKRLGNTLRALTENRLPDRLNPGGSPGVPLAGQQPQRESTYP